MGTVTSQQVQSLAMVVVEITVETALETCVVEDQASVAWWLCLLTQCYTHVHYGRVEKPV